MRGVFQGLLGLVCRWVCERFLEPRFWEEFVLGGERVVQRGCFMKMKWISGLCFRGTCKGGLSGV